MQIVNLSRQTVIANKVNIADSFRKRLLGLMTRKSYAYGEGLVLKPCNSVHSFFMKFAIDVIFIDKEFKVLHILEDMRPNHFGPIIKGAYMAIEVPSGIVPWTETQIGDKLALKAQIG